MALTFQEMMRPDSDPMGDEAGARQLLERLKRLRDPRRLPNLRVCQVVGGKVCLRSCDPFRLDEAAAAELMQLGLRSVIDLRSDHERSEGPEAPLYSHLRVLRWQPDIDGGDGAGSFVDESTCGPADDESADSAVVYRVDCLRSPQSQLRRFLADYTGPCRLCVPDVSAYLLPAACARPADRLLRDVIDCFPTALAAAFRVLARPDAYPVLLTSLDGQQVAAVVSCLLQMTLGEDPSIQADMHAASETEYSRSQCPDPESQAEDQSSQVKESRRTMLELIDYIRVNHRSAENYLLRAGLSQQEIRQLKTV